MPLYELEEILLYMEMTQKDITCLGIALDIRFTILGITLKDIT